VSTKPYLRPVDSESKVPPDGAETGSSVTTSRIPRPPAGLKAAGKRLWRSVLEGWDVEPWEEMLLLQACRCADRLDELAAIASTATAVVTNAKGDPAPHPAIVESRQQSIVLTRLLASMRLPVGDESDLTGNMRRPQRRGAARGSYGVRGAR